MVRIDALFARLVPDLITTSPAAAASAAGSGLWQLVRWLPRPAGENERQRQADPGQHGAGQEGGLVPWVSAASGFVPLSAAG